MLQATGRKGIALILAAVTAMVMVGACTQPAPTPAVHAASAAPAVNGQPITQARTCQAYVGQVLTAADEIANCTDPHNTGDATYVQPASATLCDDGRTFIAFGEAIGGIEGQIAVELPAGWALDRQTCQVTP